MSIRRHLLSVLALPFMVLVVVPGLLVRATGWEPGWGVEGAARWVLLAVVAVLLGTGLWLLVGTIRLFAVHGEGTLAPWDATRRLVVVGVYRHVRNPMISGVFLILLAETLALGSQRVMGWLLLFVAVNAIYIPLAEEPGLAGRFGDEYRAYKDNVPRWLPRLRPWTPKRRSERRDGRGSRY